MVPYEYHPLVARHCIATGINMVTSSYISPELAGLHGEAVEAGVTIMNECGLDPGIDHMLAMDVINGVIDSGNKVVHFESWCGGLPYYKFADNPLRYKFSWSPVGVLKAACNPARYLWNDEIVDVPAGGGVMDVAKPMEDVFHSSRLPLECYPNRDSLHYKDLYKIPDAHSIIRGTIRYKGYCSTVSGLIKLGLLDNERLSILVPEAARLNWVDLITLLMSSGPHSSVLAALGGDMEKYQSIKELGLLSEEPVDMMGTPLKSLAAHLEKRLEIGPDEFDTVLMAIKVGILKPDGSKAEHVVSLHMDGDPDGHTAMAVLVGKPVAIAAQLILSGKYSDTGVLSPLKANFYKPALSALMDEGIKYSTVTKDIQ
jgi:alpha-aminoadipic semialdehyde synthase